MMSFKKLTLTQLFFAILLLSCTVATYRLYHKIRFEFHNKYVEIIIPFHDIKRIHSISGKPLEDILLSFRDKGFKTIAIEERSVDDFIEDGTATMESGSNLINNQRIQTTKAGIFRANPNLTINPDLYYIMIDDTTIFDFVKIKFLQKMGPTKIHDLGNNILSISGEEKTIRDLKLGIFDGDIKSLYLQGFSVVPRLTNHYSYSEEGISFLLNSLKTGMIRHIIFSKDSVLGYPDYLESTAYKLDALSFNFGLIEFVDQKGADRLAQRIPYQVIKVHSIPEKDMKEFPESRAVSRYVRAVIERNCRLLYVNLYLDQQFEEELDVLNLQFLQHIKSSIESRGYKVSTMIQNPNTQLKTSFRFLDLFLFLTTAFLMAYCIRFYIPWTKKWLTFYILGHITFLLIGTLYNVYDTLKEYYALATAVCLPIIGYMSLLNFKQLEHLNSLKHKGRAFLKIAVSLLLTAWLTGLIINAYLIDISYYLGIRHFRGVKLAVILPILLLFLYYYIKPYRLKAFLPIMKRFLTKHVTLGYIFFFFILLLSIIIYVLRTGNYGFLILGGNELKFRSLLEQLFLIRPRTKEFLIGYPSLFIGIYFFNHYKNRVWKYFFISISAIAYVSVINTFCHIHSPVLVTLYRSFMGFLVGMTLCFILWLMHTLINKTSQKKN